jgi:aminoglycoside 6'-N-acetyltransferase
MADYRFAPLTPADLPLLRAWLDAPHMGGWWGDAGHELAIVAAEMGQGVTDQRLVWLGDTPFAYVQDYDIHTWPMPQYADQAPGGRALDCLLGEVSLLGQGHGAGFIRARALALRAQFPAVLVDPDVKNLRALAAYSRAGFTLSATADNEDGLPVCVMKFEG